MADVEERMVTLSEVKAMLEAAEEAREELTYEQKLALEHARRFARFSTEDAKKVQEELRGIGKIDSAMALRIVDLAPTHEDDVRALFAKSRVSLGDEDVQKVLETVAKYLPE